MAASKKEVILGKENMAAICISKPHGKGTTSSNSIEKQVANHLRRSFSSKSSTTTAPRGREPFTSPAPPHKPTRTKSASFTSPAPPHKPTRTKSASFTSPAPPVREPVASPAPPHKPTRTKSASFSSPAPPHKPTITKSASFSSLSTTCARKPRVAKNTIVGKPSTLSSVTRTLKKTPNACPATKRRTTTLASKRTPITKHENKENSDQQAEEVAKHDDISTVTQSNEVPRIEEMEDKFDEQKPDGSNNNDRRVVDKENDSKEEINIDHDEKENVPREETKIEIHGEEKNDEGIESVKEEANSVAKSQVEDEEEQWKKETVEEEEESRVQEETEKGKKESATPNRNVVEEKAELVEERKNSVRALVGAFETHR